MDVIIRYVIKVAVFGAAFLCAGRFFLSLFRKKNSGIEWFDPKIIFSAGIAAAVITMAVMRLIRLL
jgi:hypothetical protein